MILRNVALCLILIQCFLFVSCNEKKAKKQKGIIASDSFYSDKRQFKSFSKKFIDSLEGFFEPGFCGTALVYKNGKLYKKAFGKSDLEGKKDMEIDDLFQLASVSKTVTATAVMILVQSGKIDLEKQVSAYLSDFPYPNVSVRQLLNHRSGLANYIYYTDTFWKDTSKYMNNGEFYRFMINSKPKPYLEPDKSFSYCNTNYAFLAVLIEKVSGISFPEFVEKNIFRPAGMRNSFYKGFKPSRIKKKELQGRYEKYVYNSTYYLDGVLGDKSLYSNVEDLLMFHLALSEGRLIKKKYLKEMEKPSYDYNVFGGSYGLGFRLMNTPNGQWTYHNGWWRGFWTSFWNKFDKKACIVILTNNKRSSHVNKRALAEFLLESGK